MDSLGQPVIKDFFVDLKYSQEEGISNEVNAAYKKAFPHLMEIKDVEDISLQKKGIDKILTFEAGNEVYVDEKIRRNDYGDILLEEYSDFVSKKVGWLGREKYTDYISYMIPSSGKYYFLPFLLLQKIWLENYQDWLSKYGRKFSNNQYYCTSSIPIPTQVLINELSKSYLLSQ